MRLATFLPPDSSARELPDARPGDVVRIEIERLGAIEHAIA